MSVESLGAMRAFVHAAEKRSFKLSGQLVGLTPSAVGKAIQKMEEQLGASLFHRSTRSLTLTPEGHRFLDRCRVILAELEAAQAEIADAAGAPRGRLKISLPVEPTLLLPVISEFSAAYPEIELELDINDRFVDIVDEGFDAVIRSGEPRDSRLRHRRLGGFFWRLVASPDYVARRGAPQAIPDLVAHRCLRHRLPETGRLMPWPVEPHMEVAAVPASVVATMMEPLIELAMRGHGIACVPDFAVRLHIAQGSLVELLSGNFNQGGSLSLLWPATRHPLPKVRAFVNFVSARLTSELSELTTPRFHGEDDNPATLSPE